MSGAMKLCRSPAVEDANFAVGDVEVAVLRSRAAKPGPRLLVVNGVHGDEVACAGGLEDWVSWLRPVRGDVIVVPWANPGALRSGTRHGPDGVDLNRAFDGSAGDEPSGLLVRSLVERLFPGVDALLTLHCWSRTGCTVPYVEHPTQGGDEATLAASRALAGSLPLPFSEAYDWPPGMLPAAAVGVGIPSVEVEIGGFGCANAAEDELVTRVLDAAAVHVGVLDGGVNTCAVPIQRHWLRASAAGRARQRVALGAAVDAGAPCVEIRDVAGGVAEIVDAPASGTLAIQVTHGWVEPDEAVAVVFAPDQSAITEPRR